MLELNVLLVSETGVKLRNRAIDIVDLTNDDTLFLHEQNLQLCLDRLNVFLKRCDSALPAGAFILTHSDRSDREKELVLVDRLG